MKTAIVTMPDGSMYPIHRLFGRSMSNAKLAKNSKYSYMTMGLSMAPHAMGGIGNLCPHATKSCKMLCLNISGRSLGMGTIRDAIMKGRIARARLYYQDRATFLYMLESELEHALRVANRKGLTLISRLNVLSDVDWARQHRYIIEKFANIMFYGYTKNPHAMTRFLFGEYPVNYHLTFSRSESNEALALEFLEQGGTVAVVFDVKYSPHHKHPLPDSWNDFQVIDGDETDLRFLDPPGVVVGLRAKGLARRAGFLDDGFVVKTDS